MEKKYWTRQEILSNNRFSVQTEGLVLPSGKSWIGVDSNGVLERLVKQTQF